ncbi:hypothetical protein [Cryobacterium sp. MDB2-10]|uniref:hypothetical protein n=1 Tax=Cryobacterium sp. MDB2-10 TaxID=1259177 RepID=UPI0010740E70|nr:hypothetical protein [Cryobacterium sp. MDB2-10]TFC12516.1 hypothetical protein E3O51_18240 [Cryobacterium sp. MDB2-10]
MTTNAFPNNVTDDSVASKSELVVFTGRREFDWQIAEAIVAAHVRRTDRTSEWMPAGNKDVDIKSRAETINVKQAHVAMVLNSSGDKVESIGFMGAKLDETRPTQVVEGISHYALSLVEGTADVEVRGDTVNIISNHKGYYFLIPREVINTQFHPGYCINGNERQGRNLFIAITDIEHFRVRVTT